MILHHHPIKSIMICLSRRVWRFHTATLRLGRRVPPDHNAAGRQWSMYHNAYYNRRGASQLLTRPRLELEPDPLPYRPYQEPGGRETGLSR
jgi:hypothetical protein